MPESQLGPLTDGEIDYNRFGKDQWATIGACPPTSNSPVASKNRRWKGKSAPRSKAVQQGKRYNSRRRAPCRHRLRSMRCMKMALRSASAPLSLRMEQSRGSEGSVEPRL